MPIRLILILGMLYSSYCFSMIRALNTAAAGMAAQEAHVNTISNNISNANTTGFKRGRVEFEDLLYQTTQEAGSRSSETSLYSVGTQVGTGAKVSATRKVFDQGNPQITNRPFDFMVNGDGFFGIILPNEEMRFTRDGSFNLDAQGNLVNKQGYRVFPGFTFPANTMSITVSEDGRIDAFVRGQTEAISIGSLPIFTFMNEVGLKSSGGNLYQSTLASGEPFQHVAGTNNAGSIMQGALEASNVQIMIEMTDMIRAQRAFDMNSKVMGVADQMLQTVNNIR